MSILNHTAAEIVAAAFVELFPGIELLGERRTSLGFSYDFRCAHPLPAEAEVLIEEKVRQIVREKRLIRTLEMVPFSARELLLKEGHLARMEEISGDELVEIIQIGTFYDLSPGPHLDCSGDLVAFKLWPIETLEKRAIRLSGCAFPTKEGLKNFLKRLREYPQKNHINVGIQRSFWHLLDDQVIWLAKGLEILREVTAILRGHLFPKILEVRAFTAENRAILHAALAKEKGVEEVAEIYWESRAPWDVETGLFAGDGGGQICISYFPSLEKQEDKIISSLQMVVKTLNILGFEHCLQFGGREGFRRHKVNLSSVLKALGMEHEGEAERPKGRQRAPWIEFIVKDYLDRQWPVFSVEVTSKGFFISASIERLVAFLIEKKNCINGGLH